VVFVAAGGDTTCAIGTTSRGSCWGRGSAGQTGNGTRSTPKDPATIVTGSLFAAASPAPRAPPTRAVRSDGHVTRSGTAGPVEAGMFTTRPSPVAAPDLGDVVALNAGRPHPCALRGNGDVFCWGVGSQGQTTEIHGNQFLDPMLVSGLPHPAVGIAAH